MSLQNYQENLKWGQDWDKVLSTETVDHNVIRIAISDRICRDTFPHVKFVGNEVCRVVVEGLNLFENAPFLVVATLNQNCGLTTSQ